MEQDKNKKNPNPNRSVAPIPHGSQNRGLKGQEKTRKDLVINEKEKKNKGRKDSNKPINSEDISEERDII